MAYRNSLSFPQLVAQLLYSTLTGSISFPSTFAHTSTEFILRITVTISAHSRALRSISDSSTFTAIELMSHIPVDLQQQFISMFLLLSTLHHLRRILIGMIYIICNHGLQVKYSYLHPIVSLWLFIDQEILLRDYCIWQPLY